MPYSNRPLWWPPTSERGSARLVARTDPWPALVVLCLIALVSYLPAMLWGGFIWDDLPMIDTPAVRELTGLRQIWFFPAVIKSELHYWPLAYTSFWLQHKVWGFSPAGFHVVNVLLHLANTLPGVAPHAEARGAPEPG